LCDSLAELRAKGRIVLHGRHSPIVVVYDGGRVFALDNRCPHTGFPLDRGSVEDGILTCHWHHARFDLAMPMASKMRAGRCKPKTALYSG
jgi:nitrite reductase/ring-hydroxylating ferredoxin subunit